MSVKTAQSTLRVAVYSLVCYDGEKDPVSLAAQRDRYAKKLAENPNWVITEWFSDEITFDESEETPANFQRMLQRCREGKIDIILTKSVLRFARDAQGTITRVRELRDLGVSVIFEREDIDSRSPDCEQLITLYFGLIYRKYFWSETEDAILKAHYPKEGDRVAQRLPNRTKDSCVTRANQLGLHRLKSTDDAIPRPDATDIREQPAREAAQKPEETPQAQEEESSAFQFGLTQM